MGDEKDYWRFASLEERRRRQVRIHERTTGQTKVARSCTLTNFYMIVSFRAGGEAELSDEERRFVEQNVTPAEFAARAPRKATKKDA